MSQVARLGVAGAGTMGAGIAQLGGLAGCETLLHDPDAEALERGIERARADLQKGADRGRWSPEEARAASSRLCTVADLSELGECEVVIEAVPERLELKRELFSRLERACSPETVLATNTSSLPVGEIASGLERPERVCGMHFFNPPALMQLVEVVAAEATAEAAAECVSRLAERMGRTPVRCADSPGFIVNRCNRPYALESLRILDEGLADHAQIDAALREEGGYRMGPFELMDLIGIDVNLEVARSFHAQRPIARWQPHPIQERMVAAGRLGRKTGRGFYDYEAGDDPRSVEAGLTPGLRREIFERVVSQLVNEACFAAGEEVAAPRDIDVAMELGLNHPRGPFAWGEELGAAHVVATLEGLRERKGDERYVPAPVLERWAEGVAPL